jgi:undecaprenyl-diphosphatase
VIGSAQVLAFVPGTSRSGSTIIAGRLMGLSKKDAAEFSFLLSIPIMLGVILKLVIKSSDRAYFVDNLLTLVVGNFVAFVAGIIAVGFLMRFLEKKDLAVFGWYRILLAMVVVAFLLSGAL